jgi:hypothetical protein
VFISSSFCASTNIIEKEFLAKREKERMGKGTSAFERVLQIFRKLKVILGKVTELAGWGKPEMEHENERIYSKKTLQRLRIERNQNTRIKMHLVLNSPIPQAGDLRFLLWKN